MSVQRQIAALLVGAATLAGVPVTALAQIPFLSQLTGTATVIIPPLPASPGVAVADSAVQANTFDIATSLTTTSSGARYVPNTPFISSLDQVLFSGVNSTNDSELMPVTEPLPCDSYDPMINQIAPALMKTYLAAIANVQTNENELQGEDFSPIALNVQAAAELAATQGVGQGMLAIVQQLQLLRQQIDTLILVIASDKLHQLDANVRARMPRDESGGC